MTLIYPELKRMHSPDVYDLEKTCLEETKPYCVLLQAMFGPKGVDGEESFDVLVCNQLWVDQQSKISEFSSKHHLIVDHFDIVEIGNFLKQVALESFGSSWEEVAENLSRYGKWEFEDYVE